MGSKSKELVYLLDLEALLAVDRLDLAVGGGLLRWARSVRHVDVSHIGHLGKETKASKVRATSQRRAEVESDGMRALGRVCLKHREIWFRDWVLLSAARAVPTLKHTA
jgi:hypothetical protein